MNKLPLLIFTLAFPQLHAGTVVADFNDNTEGPLGSFEAGLGQSGGLGWLSGDVWANSATISVINGDLTAPVATGYGITQSATPQSTQGTFATGRQTTRAVDSPMTGTVWFSYLLNQPTVDSRGGITFNQDFSAPGNPRIVSVGTETRLGLAATIQNPGEGVDLLTLGETALILGRLTIDNTGNPEVLDVWINPDVSGDASALPAPDVTLTEETPNLDTGITRVGIQSYSADGQGGIVDSLRVSDAANAFEIVTRDVTITVDDPNLGVPLSNPFQGTILTNSNAPLTVDLTLENTGTTNTLTIDDTTAITGDSTNSFSILTTLPIDILPGASAVLQVQLDPAGDPRLASGILGIQSNDTSSPLLNIPLEATILDSTGNLLFNGDFEADPGSPLNWGGNDTGIAEGIAPGSTNAAALSPGANLVQNVLGDANWYLEYFFQSPDTADRAFNILIDAPEGNINLRFQGTSDGAEQTWNLFDNATAADSWGDAIALPAVQPGATYFLRITGRDWDGVNPTYDLELSAPNSQSIAGRVAGLNRYQNAIPTGAPTQIRFSAQYGGSPGFVVDDVVFKHGTPPPAGAPEITNLVFAPLAQTATLTLATQAGVFYSLQASDDLENWLEIDDFTGSGSSEVYVENGVTAPKRFYRLEVVD